MTDDMTAMEMPPELLDMDEASMIQFVEAAKASPLVKIALKMWAWKNGVQLETSFIGALLTVPSPVAARMFAVWRDNRYGTSDELIAALRNDPICREGLEGLAKAQAGG
jgi:hypothetical protein